MTTFVVAITLAAPFNFCRMTDLMSPSVFCGNRLWAAAAEMKISTYNTIIVIIDVMALYIYIYITPPGDYL